MANHICLFSEPLLRRYITNSRISKAYLFYMSYWIAILAPPLIFVIGLPQESPRTLSYMQPIISYTGNYFISLSGSEYTSRNPFPGLTVDANSVDPNNDNVNEYLSLKLSVIDLTNFSPLFFAIELKDENGNLGIARANLDLPSVPNRLHASFDLTINHARNITSAASDLNAVLSQPGQKGLNKLAAILSPFELVPTGFGIYGDTVRNSKSLMVDISIYIPPTIISRPTSTGDLVRQNILNFLVYLMANYHILNWFMGLFVKSGIVRMRTLVDTEDQSKRH
jgi:hypothetical protein